MTRLLYIPCSSFSSALICTCPGVGGVCCSVIVVLRNFHFQGITGKLASPRVLTRRAGAARGGRNVYSFPQPEGMTPFGKVLLTVARVKSSLYIEFTIVNIVGDLVSKSLAVKPPLAGDVPLSGWRRALTTPSLPEAHRSIPVRPDSSWFRKILAFAGPGYLIAVGYMDPGNWATDIGGGSKFGYVLLSAVLISNILATFLQALSAKLGIVTGRDLAQACRDHYSRGVSIFLWIACEL